MRAIWWLSTGATTAVLGRPAATVRQTPNSRDPGAGAY
jgi:hypothetical protein